MGLGVRLGLGFWLGRLVESVVVGAELVLVGTASFLLLSVSGLGSVGAGAG
jgi:hypothetical protein